MELIDKNQYISNQLIDKIFLAHRTNKYEEVYYLFKINNILNDNPITYETERLFYFYRPTDNRTKCYCYNGDKEFILMGDDQLYQISVNEYLDIFKKFIEYDSKDKYNININFC